MSETNTEVFLPQIISKGFDIFKSLDNEARLKQIGKIHYIDTIARSLEKNIDNVDLFKLFPNKDNVLTCTENEINKILAKFDATNIAKREIQKLTKLQSDNIIKASNVWNIENRRQLERNIASRNSKIVDYSTALETQIVERNKARFQLEQITDSDGTELQSQIEAILATKKYKLNRIDSDKISFTILDEVINTYKNDRVNVDIRVNLGQFDINVLWNGMKTRVYGSGNNTMVGRYYHPHYDEGGQPCLGNLQEVMNEAMSKRDLQKILEINDALLRNYNVENPFVTLSRFAMESQQIQPNGKAMDKEVGPQAEGANLDWENECGNCGHYHTITFDNNGDYDGDCPECGEWESFNYIDVR